MSITKAVILCGGLGTRLNMFTRRIANKHVALVYDRPMAEFPVSTLSQAGVTDLCVVVGSHHSGDVMKLLGDGREFGFKNISYKLQLREGGIAEALQLAEDFVGDDTFALILGDNIFESDMSDHFNKFTGGCSVLLQEVHDPHRFGVAEISEGKVISIEEKPKEPKSNLAITGLYLMDHRAFDKAKTLKPSRRGELEITDVLDSYLKEGELKFSKHEGFWSDTGTVESLHHTACWLKDNNHKLVSGGRFSKYAFKLDNGFGDYLTKTINYGSI